MSTKSVITKLGQKISTHRFNLVNNNVITARSSDFGKKQHFSSRKSSVEQILAAGLVSLQLCLDLFE